VSRDVYTIDREALPFVAAVESNGLHVDLKAAERLRDESQEELDTYLSTLRRIVGDEDFLPGSTSQVGNYLQMHLPARRLLYTKTGKVCTNKKVLARCRDDMPDFTAALTIYRFIRDKMLGTYLNPLLRMGQDVIHPHVNYVGAVSGRWSDRKGHYGFLTMPIRNERGRRLRGLFGPAPGMLIGTWDLSQIELRVAAHVSQDPILAPLFREGRDLHADTMEAFGLPRPVAKTVNFRVLYAGPEGTGSGMADQLLIAGVRGYTAKMCDEIIRAWFDRYSGIKRAIAEAGEEARSRGYVEDMWGRRRYLPATRLPAGVSWSLDKVIGEADRQAFNHKIQPAVSGLIKRAEKRITDSELFRSGKLKPLLQIHDEVLCQFRERDTKKVDKLMRSALLADADMFSVPIDCSGAWGRNWGELKD
jgi:DNA polymerase-1